MLAARRTYRTSAPRWWLLRRLLSNDNNKINIQDTLRKAAAGDLTHKEKPIPKLAGRVKHVPGLEHQSSRSKRAPWDALSEQEPEMVEDESVWGGEQQGGSSNTVMATTASSDQLGKSAQSMDVLLQLYANDPRCYWNEADYDEVQTENSGMLLEGGNEMNGRTDQSLSLLSKPSDMEDRQDMDADEEDISEEDDKADSNKKVVSASERDSNAITSPKDPDYEKWLDFADIIQALGKDSENDPMQNLSPVQIEEFQDRLSTIRDGIDMWNPDPQYMYMSERYENPHPDLMREPVPHFPKNRLRPPLSFVERYTRFIYVTGLLPVDFDADLTNSTHRFMLQKSIASLFRDVDSSQVWPTNLQSGFIGFERATDAVTALASGPDPKFHSRPPMFSTLSNELAETHKDFGSRETTLLLEYLPKRRYTSVSLLRDLFPPNTEIGEAYHTVTAEDIKFISSSKALIRFQSVDQAVSILQRSKLIMDQLHNTVGRYPIQVFRARRELVHAGFGPFPLRQEERKLGPRLIVQGDMPTQPFYHSHADCLLAINVDPSWTAADILARVQEYCTQKLSGSVEFVTSESGERTGQAYIGFDLPGEADAALEALGSMVQWGDRTTILKRVRDRKYPHCTYQGPERRPDRPADTLLDDLDNWEQFVDAEDVQKIYDAGISKDVLNDALRSIRYSNRTFGPLDSAMREESLEPEKETGQQYRDIVKLYIETLLECLPNPDAGTIEDMNIPDTYLKLHQPNEEIDLSIFEKEKERVAAQSKFRSQGQHP